MARISANINRKVHSIRNKNIWFLPFLSDAELFNLRKKYKFLHKITFGNTRKKFKKIYKSIFLPKPYESLKEEFYFHAFLANYAFFHCIQKQYQREYFKRLNTVFAPLKKDKNFTWKYFDEHQKSEVLYWMSGSYDRYMRARILKFIFSCDKDMKSHYIQILGMKIRF